MSSSPTTAAASAAGIKVYIDGACSKRRVEADSLKGSIKTNVPFKLSQRNQSSRIDGVALQDLRIYNRVLSPRRSKRWPDPRRP